MASITVSNEVKCAIALTDTELQMTEMVDKWSDAGLSVKNNGDGWEFDVWRHEDQARLYANEFQMRELRDWLNKHLKD
jgi:hypothetical protein